MNVRIRVKTSSPIDGGAEAPWVLQIARARGLARVVLCAAIVLGGVILEAAPLKPNSSRYATLDGSRVLNPGDIVFTDSEAAVLKLNPVTKQTAVVAMGGPIVRPCGIAIGPENVVYVTDTGSLAVIAINPATGESTVLTQGDKLGVPFGIAVNADGEIFVANGQSVVGINPADGTQRTVASGGLLKVPLGVAAARNGDLYVADAGGSVVHIDLPRGEQAIVTAGQNLMTPVGIVVQDHKTIFIADSTARRIIQVDSRTGDQRIVSAEGTLCSPFGLALWGESHLLVGDPDAFEVASGIISIDLQSGAQSPLAIGSGNLVNYRCVAVAPGQ